MNDAPPSWLKLTVVAVATGEVFPTVSAVRKVTGAEQALRFTVCGSEVYSSTVGGLRVMIAFCEAPVTPVELAAIATVPGTLPLKKKSPVLCPMAMVVEVTAAVAQPAAA